MLSAGNPGQLLYGSTPPTTRKSLGVRYLLEVVIGLYVDQKVARIDPKQGGFLDTVSVMRCSPERTRYRRSCASFLSASLE